MFLWGIKMMLQLFSNLFLILSFIIFSVILSSLFFKNLKRKDLFNRYDKLIAILNGSKEIAYQKVFREDLLVHSGSGFKVDKSNMDDIQKKYLKMVFYSCGSKIIDDLTELYGDIESLSILIVNEFIQRVENDETIILDAVRDREKMKSEV